MGQQYVSQISNYSLTKKQFTQLFGKCRLYPFLPKELQHEIPPMMLGDAQIKSVAQDYYKDSSFCRSENGDINLWRLYNLLTSANKSTYIDSFIERSVCSFQFTEQLKSAIAHNGNNWFLN